MANILGFVVLLSIVLFDHLDTPFCSAAENPDDRRSDSFWGCSRTAEGKFMLSCLHQEIYPYSNILPPSHQWLQKMFSSETWAQPPLLVVHSLTPQPCKSLLMIDLISFILNLLGFIERNFLQRHFFTCSGSSSQPPQLFAPSQTCLQICLSRKPLGTFASSVSNVKPSLLEWHLPRFFFHYHTHSIAYHNQSILEHFQMSTHLHLSGRHILPSPKQSNSVVVLQEKAGSAEQVHLKDDV